MSEKLVAEQIKFQELCLVFETLKTSLSSARRLHFNKFHEKWQDLAVKNNPDGTKEYNTNNSFYEALRLFAPSLDNRSFGIKGVRNF